MLTASQRIKLARSVHKVKKKKAQIWYFQGPNPGGPQLKV